MNKLISQLLYNMPRRLPVGKAQFEAFSDRIILLCGEFADRQSMIFALASILIHADAKYGRLPDKYFVDRLIKSAANQVASQFFQDIKNEQIAKEQIAKEKKQAEDTANKETVSNVEVLSDQKV